MFNVGTFLFAVWLSYVGSQPQQQHTILKGLLILSVIGSAICYLLVAFQHEQKLRENTSIKAGHPVPAEIKTLEEWTEAGRNLKEIYNQIFTHEEVILDGKSFTGCTFNHVNLFYNGTAPMALINCTFDDDTRTHFHTRSPAMAQWTDMMRALEALRPHIKIALSPLPDKGQG